MFFSRSPKEELSIIVEIQSSVVRGSLVLMREKQIPHILYTVSTDLAYKSGTTSAYLVKTTLHAVSGTLDLLSRRHHELSATAEDMPRHVKSVHYVLSSPWIISQAKTVSMKFPHETELTHAKIMEIIAAERSKLSLADAETEVVEEKIFDVRLNGYSVASWQDKPASEVEVSFVVSLSGANMSRRLRDACERIVRKGKVHFHSSLLLEAIGIGIVMPQAENFMLVNVHGELTEVTIVKHRRCVFFGSYPMGIRTIVRKVARATKTDEGAADSLISMHAADALDPAHGKPVQPLVADIMKGWASDFEKLFKNAISGGPLPPETFIAAHKHEALFIRNFAESHHGARVMSFGIDRLEKHVSFDAGTEKRRAIGLSALAINSLGTE